MNVLQELEALGKALRLEQIFCAVESTFAQTKIQFDEPQRIAEAKARYDELFIELSSKILDFFEKYNVSPILSIKIGEPVQKRWHYCGTEQVIVQPPEICNVVYVGFKGQFVDGFKGYESDTIHDILPLIKIPEKRDTWSDLL